MRKWWRKKKGQMRKSKKDKGDYTFWDGVLDVLLWVPELILLPLRVIFWLLRGISRNIVDFF
ncbi:hypothetical protein ACFOGI_14645 [Virgibacillus xinjiangensis]|uniref:Uncharacterized protein n=1 Tax=Virgibacillus xinjiangensis TaxID=393090 RepID=A0ABV7CYL6_9BACI